MPHTLKKKMHGSLYNHNLWHKTGSNQKLDGGKAWNVPKHKVSSYIMLSGPKSSPKLSP